MAGRRGPGAGRESWERGAGTKETPHAGVRAPKRRRRSEVRQPGLSKASKNLLYVAVLASLGGGERVREALR